MPGSQSRSPACSQFFSLLTFVSYAGISPFPYTTLFRSWGLRVKMQDRVALTRWDVRRQCVKSQYYRTSGALAPCSARSEEHTSELQSHVNLVCRLLLEKKK